MSALEIHVIEVDDGAVSFAAVLRGPTGLRWDWQRELGRRRYLDDPHAGAAGFQGKPCWMAYRPRPALTAAERIVHGSVFEAFWSQTGSMDVALSRLADDLDALGGDVIPFVPPLAARLRETLKVGTCLPFSRLWDDEDWVKDPWMVLMFSIPDQSSDAMSEVP